MDFAFKITSLRSFAVAVAQPHNVNYFVKIHFLTQKDYLATNVLQIYGLIFGKILVM
jgi:hypothetical protein